MADDKKIGWFGPGKHIESSVPDGQRFSVDGRQFDFQVGANIQLRPRAGELITAEQLRGLAEYDVLSSVIETRKDQLCMLKFAIKYRDKKKKADARCDKIKDFLRFPDREHTWEDWLRMILHDMLVIDAATIYPRMDRGGKMYSLDPVDGATIMRLIDDSGRTPADPDAAYQQILKGVAAAQYTRDELIYRPRNMRTNRLYGYSPVEQIVMTINISLRRQLEQLSYYTQGNVPNLIFQVPADWDIDQVKDFQTWWDSVNSGATKHNGKFVPNGVAPYETKTPPLKDLYDEWLARVVCYVFSVSPQPFVSQVNKATADTAKASEKAEGIAPHKSWIKGLIDGICAKYFRSPDLELFWDEDDETDPLVQAQIDEIHIATKVVTPAEVRERLGYDPMTPDQIASMAVAPAPQSDFARIYKADDKKKRAY